MPQIYLFIGALLAVIFIVSRRSFIFDRDRKQKLKEEISHKVDELHKERQEMQKERFKDSLIREQQQKKYDFSQFKLTLRKADMSMAKKQWGEAKKLLIQSLALTKEELPVSLKLATVYMKSGDLKRAESLFKRLVEINRENPSIHENLAKIYVQQKRFKEAIHSYVQAIELDDMDDKKLVALGRLYQLLMRPSLAGECYRRAAELKPREVSYLFLLAEACKNDGDYDNALFTYEKILTLEPYKEKATGSAQDVRIKMNEMEKVLA